MYKREYSTHTIDPDMIIYTIIIKHIVYIL